jgi:hypothetical protein
MDADLYIIDPMRCMHAEAENDSALEALLSRVHQIFRDATVVISHHLRKRDRKSNKKLRLRDDMRVWADEARGSSAITAHADVIVCQEREVEDGVETLHVGAYLRDAADIEPMLLRESSMESFFWQPATDVSSELSICLDALREAGGKFRNRSAAVLVLQSSLGAGRSTGYTRLKDLINRGLITEIDGTVKIADALDAAETVGK